MPDYSADQVHIELVKEATTWRHGDAKWTSSDVLVADELIALRLFEPTAVASPIGRANSYLGHWRSNQYAMGFLEEVYFMQTGRLLYPFMGACSTVEATPNVHTISPRASQTPLNHGRHLEIENETDAESERIDFMGMLPITYHCEMSEVQPKATQIATWGVAFTKSVGTDDITEPTVIADEPFDWTGITFPTFTYNSETLECDILGWSFDVNNNVFWRGLDSGGRYSIGKMGNFVDISVTLNIVPTGKNTKELIRTVLESYATDLDLTVNLARSATDDVEFTHDKMYMTPYDIVVPSRTKWIEGYFITLHQLNKGNDLETVIQDIYNNDHYENP